MKEIDINKWNKLKNAWFAMIGVLRILVINWTICLYKCHDVLLMAYGLKSIAALNVKGVDYRYVLWNMTKNDAINSLNNFIW